MSRSVPQFPIMGEPGEWDRLTLLASTIFLEAEGEAQDGKLAVGYVVMNRIRLWGQDLHHAILGSDRVAYGDERPFEVFSCFNDDYRARAMARLASATVEAVEPCWKAAAAALWGLVPDPVNGATFYLNLAVTLRIRGGTLPIWAADPTDNTKLNSAKVRAVLGRHTFLGG